MNFLKEYGSPKNLNCVWEGARLTHALGVGHAGAPGTRWSMCVRVLPGVLFRLFLTLNRAPLKDISSPVDKAERGKWGQQRDRLH